MKPMFAPLARTHYPRKWRPCLKCGKRLFTDPYHRLCEICTVENEHISAREGRVVWALAESIAASGDPPRDE